MSASRSALLSLLLLLVLAGAGAGAVAPAQASWLGEQKLGHASYLGDRDVALTSDARGDAAVAWAAADGVRVAFAKPGARFGPGSLIPASSGGGRPAVAIDDQGDAVVAWTYVDDFYVPPIDARDEPCCNRVRAAILRRGHPVGAAQTLTARGTDAVLAAVAVGHGRAGVAYDDRPVDPADGVGAFDAVRVQLSLAAPPGRFRTRARTIAMGDVGARSLALSAGAATVVYSVPALNPFIPFALVAGKLDFGGGRAALRRIGTFTIGLAGGLGPALELAGNARGEQAGLFEQGLDGRPQSLELATRTAGGGFALRTLDAVASGYFDAPEVAVAPSGRGLVTWSRSETGAVRVALAGVGRPVRAAGVVHPLKAGAQIYSGADAVNDRGQAAIILGTQGVGRAGGVRAVLRSARGHYGVARDLDSPGAVLAQPLVTIDARGRGIVVWETGTSVRAERFRTG